MILGAGPIAIELAQAFARLGSDVHVIHRGPRILSREDADLAGVVENRLVMEGVQFHFGTTVQRADRTAGGISLLLRDEGGERSTLEGSHLLVATGRAPNVEDLGLEAAGVALDERDFIATDRRLRTSNPRVLACGDVVGRHQFTHVAEHQAAVVLKNALFRFPAKIEERVVPWCTFTDPELARVGLSVSRSLGGRGRCRRHRTRGLRPAFRRGRPRADRCR